MAVPGVGYALAAVGGGGESGDFPGRALVDVDEASGFREGVDLASVVYELESELGVHDTCELL